MNCVAIIYDVNGHANPNEYEKDLKTSSNVKPLSKSCIAETGNTCVTKKAFKPEPLTKADCLAIKDSLGIDRCCDTCDSQGGDYWAGAVKACGGIDKVASPDALMEIANDIYGGFSNLSFVKADAYVNDGYTFTAKSYRDSSKAMEKYGISGWTGFFTTELCGEECEKLGRMDRVYRLSYQSGNRVDWSYGGRFRNDYQAICIEP